MFTQLASLSPFPDSELRCGDLLHGVSSTYVVERFLGEGSFGKVARCLKSATQERVAVKIFRNQPRLIEDARQEIRMLQSIQELDTSHIVRWSGWFESGPHFCLEFELLDRSLRDVLDWRKRMTLKEINEVLYQLATALTLLETFEIIHADLKPENIMVVDCHRPLKVKLIDFGLARHISQVQVGDTIVTQWYRAPELLLGLPYTGDVDVWALGCVAVEMFTGFPIYPGFTEHQMLEYITETQGPFPDFMLDFGIKTKRFFNKGWLWTLKSSDQYFRETGVRDVWNEECPLKSLDELLESEAGDQVEKFVGLLKEMLQLDPELRITPRDIVCTLHHGNAEHDDTRLDNAGSGCLDMVTSLSLSPNSSLASEEQTRFDLDRGSTSECCSKGGRNVSSSRDMVTRFRRNSTEQSGLQQLESCDETSSSFSYNSATEVISDHSGALRPAADVQKAGKWSKVKLKTLCCCCCPTVDAV
ncbi:homeodomain-interacting protein kinase 2 isoform X2 [Gadus morhua]|uniref:homeodomain-interacting protein kinase 2 isoform X2 n=1 Tax=Gadus morhua TaxID=8049 RepID=UPI0011B85595|nr:homeodomain-interacting protein kinase 2-like isoform X2 [Gadus morhua]